MSSPDFTLKEKEFGGIRTSFPDTTLKDKGKEKKNSKNERRGIKRKWPCTGEIQCSPAKRMRVAESTDESEGSEDVRGVKRKIEECDDYHPLRIKRLKPDLGFGQDKNAKEKGVVGNFDAVDAPEVKSATQDVDEKRGRKRQLEMDDEYSPLAMKKFQPMRGIGARMYIPPRCCKPHMVLKRVLGRGSFAVAVLRSDQQSGTKVVDKMITSFNLDDIQSVQREVRFLNRVKEIPQCITFRDYYVCGLTPGKVQDHHLLMNYFEGETLMSFIDRKQLTEAMKREILKQLGLGLQSIHRKGIIYCDCKVDNVLVNDDLEVRIIDFGGSQSGPKSRFYNGALFCKPPEIVCRGKQPDSEDGPRYFSYASDFYQLGHIAYEMEYCYGPSEFAKECIFRNTHLPQATIDDFKRIFHVPYDIVVFPYRASDDYADLLEGLFEKDPAVRLQDGTFLNHRYFNPDGGIKRTRQDGSVKTVNSPESLKHLTVKTLIERNRNDVAKQIKAMKNLKQG